MKAKPCILCMNSSLNGYIFTPMECESISKALKIAREWGCPYRLFDAKGNLIRKGWLR